MLSTFVRFKQGIVIRITESMVQLVMARNGVDVKWCTFRFDFDF